MVFDKYVLKLGHILNIVKRTPKLTEEQCPQRGVNCTDKRLKETLEANKGASTLKLEIAKIFVKEKKLSNGQPLYFLNDEDNENFENLFFWDANKEAIVPPYFVNDEDRGTYYSVPPNFVVGDEDFAPEEWLNLLNGISSVFPSKNLIEKLKDLLKKSENVVKIKDKNYLVDFGDVNLENIDSAMIGVGETAFADKEAFPYTLFMTPGIEILNPNKSSSQGGSRSRSKRSKSKRSKSKRSKSKRSRRSSNK
jgi:hypothetical protein